MAVARRLPSCGKKASSLKSPLVLGDSETVATSCDRVFVVSRDFTMGSPTNTNALETNRSYDSLASTASRHVEADEKDWWMVSGTSERSPSEAAPPAASPNSRCQRLVNESHPDTKSAPTSPSMTNARRSATTPWRLSSESHTSPSLDAMERCHSVDNIYLQRRGSPTPRSPGGIGDPTAPSPRRRDRVAEFPASPSPSPTEHQSLRYSQSSPLQSPQLRRRKLRSSIGSSDLSKARPLVARSDDGDEVVNGGTEENVDRDHFIVDTEIAFHRESNNDYRLNQYVLGKQIGRGAYGTVIEARNIYDQKNYAVKVMSKRKLKKAAFGHKLGKRGSLGAVRREIAILKKVRHRNVVKLFEIINAEGETDMYLVFELVEHGQVLEVNRGECLSEERAWDYFIDLLLGVEYLHSLGIVHRDIKPSNLLIDAEDRLKIADFGVSEMFEKDGPTRLSKTAGSPAFMAPEMLTTEPGESVNYEAKPLDVWSMGVTLYCWIYGQCPFWPEKPNDFVELQSRIAEEELAFPDEPPASDEVKDLLARLLEKNPEKRITIAEMKRHRWVTSRLGRFAQSCRLEKEMSVDRFSITSEDIQNAVKENSRVGSEGKMVVLRERLRSPASDSDSAFQSATPSRDVSSSSLLSTKTSCISGNRRSPSTDDECLS